MRTINSYHTDPVTLSEELYEITSNSHPSCNYKAGTVVRLISGVVVDGECSPLPGDHFNPDYFTVCRADADTAEFCGILRTDLKLLPPVE